MVRDNLEGVVVAATGTAWVGSGVGSVNTAIENLLRTAKSEVQIAVYDLTEGAEEFQGLLRGTLARGIQVTMIVNRLGEKSTNVQEDLAHLTARYRHFLLFDFSPKDKKEDLHAKIFVRDRSQALVGSANITWKGLVQNHELAVVVSGSPASTIAGLIDALTRDSRVRRVR
jgi:cardiolipin synthase